MEIPNKLVLQDGAIAADGGSLFLIVTDESGRQRSLDLPQSRIPENFREGRAPGVLHLDESPCEPNGAAEQQLLAALTAAADSA